MAGQLYNLGHILSEFAWPVASYYFHSGSNSHRNRGIYTEVGCSKLGKFLSPVELTLSLDSPSDPSSVPQVCLHRYRTNTTLCVPSPSFGHETRHTLPLPLDRPLHQELMAACRGAGGVAFELWRRFYYPNIRDQLVARVMTKNCVVHASTLAGKGSSLYACSFSPDLLSEL